MPRQFLIDGYNLAFAWEPVRRAMLIDKQRGREALIDRLARYKKASGCGMTVVFDGRHLPGGEGPQAVRGIKVVYAKRPASADDEIYRMVSACKNRGSLTVVSSDRQVAGFARRNGASSMGSGEFAERATARSEESGEKPEKADVGDWAEYFGVEDKPGGAPRGSP
jgi:predicted RNA-binding protein with PIN domain